MGLKITTQIEVDITLEEIAELIKGDEPEESELDGANVVSAILFDNKLTITLSRLVSNDNNNVGNGDDQGEGGA